MRVFGSPQDQEVLRFIQEIKEAGIAPGYLDYESDDLVKYFIEIECGTDRGADLVQNPELLPCQIQSFLYVFKGIRTRHNWAARAETRPPHLFPLFSSTTRSLQVPAIRNRQKQPDILAYFGLLSDRVVRFCWKRPLSGRARKKKGDAFRHRPEKSDNG